MRIIDWPQYLDQQLDDAQVVSDVEGCGKVAANRETGLLQNHLCCPRISTIHISFTCLIHPVFTFPLDVLIYAIIWVLNVITYVSDW